jgi:DNA-binding beta-propeller fold protein YncE
VPETGFPVPNFAPAAIFNISTGSFEKFSSNITNASALAYDPGNGLLYATEPSINSVLVVDPVTGAIVGPPISVGISPDAIVFDSTDNSVVVANSGSGNLSVIDTLTNRISIGNVPVGSDPSAIADDAQDGLLFVANGASDFITTLSASNPADSLAQITLLDGPSTSLAFSARTDNLVATIPTSNYATVINAETKTVVSSVISVGKDFDSAASTANGTEFVIGNSSAGNLVVLNSTFGTVIDSSFLVDKNVSELVLDPTTGVIFCWTTEYRILEKLNLTSNTATVESPTTSPQLVALGYSPNQSDLLVSAGNDSIIYVLNQTRLDLAAPSINTAAPALSVSVDPSAGLLFIGTSNGLEIYNTTSNRFVGSISALSGGNTQLVLDSEDGLLWLANSLAGVEAVNLTTDELQISTEIPVSPGTGVELALDPSGSRLFLLVSPSAVEVLNSRTGKVVEANLAVGSNVTSIAYDPVDNQVYAAGDAVSFLNATSLALDGTPVPLGGSHKVLSEIYEPSRESVFVASVGLLSGDQGTVTVVDGTSIAASDAAVTEIPVGEQPDAFAVVPSSNATVPGSAMVWVANEMSGTISVIASPPEIEYFAATPDAVDLGYTTTINTTFVGGAGSSRITYFGLPGGCATADTSSLVCTPSSAGTFTLSVNVTDSFGVWANESTSLTVARELTISVACQPSTLPIIDPGVALACGASASDGLAPYSFSWSTSDGAHAAGPTISHSFSTPGVYIVTAQVRDSSGASNSSSTEVTVVPSPTAVISIAPGNATDVGSAIVFNATVSGGTAPLNSNWTFGDGSRASGANASHTWTRPGNYTVTFDYEDTLGVVTSKSVVIAVHPSFEATLSSGSGTVFNPTAPATPVTFTALVTGGTPPYLVSWAFGDGSSARGLTVSHSYATPGRFGVEATLTDHVGATVTANLTLFVNQSASSVGGLGSLTGGFGAGLFLGFLVGGVLAAVVLFSIGNRKGRRTRGGPVSPYVPP